MDMSLLLAGFDHKKEAEKAMDYARSVSERWDVPRGKGVPADLKDEAGNWYKTRDGQLITAALFESDFGAGDESVRSVIHDAMPVALMIIAVLSSVSIWLALVVGIGMQIIVTKLKMNPIWIVTANFFLFISVGGMSLIAKLQTMQLSNSAAYTGYSGMQAAPAAGNHTAQIGVSFVLMLLSIIGFLFMRSELKRYEMRDDVLNAQASNDGGESNQIDYLLSQHVAARQSQVDNAKRDVSTFLTFGSAVGAFSGMGDKYAPDAGLPFGMTIADLSTGLFVFGETGSGKTSGVLRPLAHAIAKAKDEVGRPVGILVLDGKGELPIEMSSLPDYTLLSPARSDAKLALIRGLGTEEVVSTLVSVFEKAGGDFWVKSAETLLRSALIILETASIAEPGLWTLVNARRMCTDREYRDSTMAGVEAALPETDENSLIHAGLRYFKVEFPGMAENTSSGIVATCDSWLSPIVGHRELLAWAACADGVDITSCLRGERVGIAVPEFRYGRAGAAVSALAKARIYNALKNRGSAWKSDPAATSVSIIIDEAQSVLGAADVSMLAIGRSLGLRAICASQHIDGIDAHISKDQSRALLGNFVSIVSFTSTAETLAYVSERVGHVPVRYTAPAPEASINGMDVGRLVRIQHERQSNRIDSKVKRIEAQMGTMGEPHIVKDNAIQATRSALLRKAQDVGFFKSRGNDGKTPVPEGFMTEIKALFEKDSGAAWLRAPFHCVAQVKRAGVIRRDIVKVTPMF